MQNNRFIVVAGPPCSGKTTLAAAIASALSAPHFDIDDVPRNAWTEESRDAAYCVILDRAMEAVASGPVVVSATYGRAAKRQELLERVRGRDLELCLIQCWVPADVAATRFLARGPHPALDLTEDRVRSLAQNYEYDEGGLLVDARRPTVDIVAEMGFR